MGAKRFHTSDEIGHDIPSAGYRYIAKKQCRNRSSALHTIILKLLRIALKTHCGQSREDTEAEVLDIDGRLIAATVFSTKSL